MWLSWSEVEATFRSLTIYFWLNLFSFFTVPKYVSFSIRPPVTVVDCCSFHYIVVCN